MLRRNNDEARTAARTEATRDPRPVTNPAGHRMSRRQQLAFTLQRWELHREGAAYMLRMRLAQRLMPADLRFVTLQLWAEFQSVKLAYLERLAREYEDDRGPRIEVPIEHLARYL